MATSPSGESHLCCLSGFFHCGRNARSPGVKELNGEEVEALIDMEKMNGTERKKVSLAFLCPFDGMMHCVMLNPL